MSSKSFLTLLILIGTIMLHIGTTNLIAKEQMAGSGTVPTLADLGVQLTEIQSPRPLPLSTAVTQVQSRFPNQSEANIGQFPLEPFAPAGHFEMLLFSNSTNLAVGPNDLLIGYHQYGILSSNRGISWRLIEDNHAPTTIGHAGMPPSESEPIFVVNGHGHLLRSLDKGQSWEQVAQNLYHIQQAVYSPSYERDGLIFAYNSNELARSNNRGETWTINPIPNLQRIAVASNFVDSQIVLGSRWDAVYISTDGGYGWQLANNGLHLEQGNVIYDILFSPNHASDNFVYAVTRYGVYRTRTNGLDWWRILPFSIKKFALHPNFPNVPTFFMIATVQIDGQLFDALFRSDDNGQTFRGLALGVTDFGLSSQYVANQSLYAMVPEGLIYSNDNGSTWYIMSQSLGNADPQQLVASPNMAVDRTVYLVLARHNGLVHHEVWRSSSLGLSWQKLPIPKADSHDIFLAISPNFAVDQTIMLLVFAHQQWSELYRSTDGGNSWHLLKDQLPFGDASAFQLSPNYAQDQTIFVASHFDHGLFRSQNNGQTWQNLAPDKFLRDFAIAPEYPTDNRLFISIANQGISQSNNGGVTWSSPTHPSFQSNLQIVLSPNLRNDNTLFVMNGHDSGGGVWRSEDTGLSWTPASNDQMTYFQNTISLSDQFTQDQTAVVGVQNRGLFMTENGGDDWFRLDGSNLFGLGTTIPRTLSTVTYWQALPRPILLDKTGYYFYFWPSQTSAGFSCQNLQLESDESQWAMIAVGANTVQPLGWHLHNHDIPWLFAAPPAGMTPTYPQAQIDTANLFEPAQATLTLDVYLSYRQRQSHTFSAFVPCYGQNLPAVRKGQ